MRSQMNEAGRVADVSRRAFLYGSGACAAFALAGCASTQEGVSPTAAVISLENPDAAAYALMYGPVEGEKFPVGAIDLTKIDPAFLRREVAYSGPEKPGSIVIDPAAHYLYYVQPNGGPSAMASASASKVSSGTASPPSIPSRNGRTGIRQRR